HECRLRRFKLGLLQDQPRGGFGDVGIADQGLGFGVVDFQTLVFELQGVDAVEACTNVRLGAFDLHHAAVDVAQGGGDGLADAQVAAFDPVGRFFQGPAQLNNGVQNVLGFLGVGADMQTACGGGSRQGEGYAQSRDLDFAGYSVVVNATGIRIAIRRLGCEAGAVVLKADTGSREDLGVLVRVVYHRIADIGPADAPHCGEAIRRHLDIEFVPVQQGGVVGLRLAVLEPGIKGELHAAEADLRVFQGRVIDARTTLGGGNGVIVLVQYRVGDGSRGRVPADLQSMRGAVAEQVTEVALGADGPVAQGQSLPTRTGRFQR